MRAILTEARSPLPSKGRRRFLPDTMRRATVSFLSQPNVPVTHRCCVARASATPRLCTAHLSRVQSPSLSGRHTSPRFSSNSKRVFVNTKLYETLTERTLTMSRISACSRGRKAGLVTCHRTRHTAAGQDTHRRGRLLAF